MAENETLIRTLAEQKYEHGFTTDVETEVIPRGLNEDVVRLISSKKGEPEWLLEFRLQAFRYWQQLTPPTWGHVNLPDIDYQDISYYADPTKGKTQKNPEDIDPDAPLFGDAGLGLDSIDALELTLILERDYGLRISQEEGRQVFRSVRTMAEYISSKKA